MAINYNDGMDISPEMQEAFKRRREEMLAHMDDVKNFERNSVEEDPQKKTFIAALWSKAAVKGTTFILLILILLQLGAAINKRVNKINTEEQAKAYLAENYPQAYNSFTNTNYLGNKWVDDVRAADAIVADAIAEKQERTGEENIENMTLSHEDLELHLSIFATYINVKTSFPADADLRSAMNDIISRINSELGTSYESFEDYVKEWSHFGKYSAYREALYNLAASKGYNVEVLAQMGIEDAPSQGGRK